MTTVKRWNVADDPDLNVPTRERVRAAMMSIGATTHAERDRWATKAPDNVAIGPAEAWDEAEPVHYPNAANGCVTRLHVPTGMLLLARQGSLVTCYQLGDRERPEQVYIQTQVSDL